MEDFASKLRGLDFSFKTFMRLLQSDKTMAAMLKQRDAILNPEDDTLMLRAANEIESLRQQLADLTARLEASEELNKKLQSLVDANQKLMDVQDRRENRQARLEAQEASEPHPPTRHCMCDDCKPSFDEAIEPVAWYGESDDGECHLYFDKQDMLREVLRIYTYYPLYRTPQPTKQEASEPVCWITPDGVGWRMRFEPPVNDVPLGWTPLYETPQPTTTVQAAVSAALRKAAEGCDSLHERNCQSITESGCPPCDCYADVFKKAILALPHDDSALEQYVQERINETTV